MSVWTIYWLLLITNFNILFKILSVLSGVFIVFLIAVIVHNKELENKFEFRLIKYSIITIVISMFMVLFIPSKNDMKLLLASHIIITELKDPDVRNVESNALSYINNFLKDKNKEQQLTKLSNK